MQQRERGDEEAMVMDEDYIRALSYGMPPAAGIGVGIDASHAAGEQALDPRRDFVSASKTAAANRRAVSVRSPTVREGLSANKPLLTRGLLTLTAVHHLQPERPTGEQ